VRFEKLGRSGSALEFFLMVILLDNILCAGIIDVGAMAICKVAHVLAVTAHVLCLPRNRNRVPRGPHSGPLFFANDLVPMPNEPQRAMPRSLCRV
jgi:hypothetical protein